MFFLPELIDFEIENIQVSEQLVQGTFRSKTNTVACPVCLVPARRVQSRYRRTLADLPLCGLRFQLKLLVRRFYCDKLTCVRRIFSERFPTLTKPYASVPAVLAKLSGKSLWF
jgi:transposase